MLHSDSGSRNACYILWLCANKLFKLPWFLCFFVWVLISLYSKFYLFGRTEIDRSVYCHSLLNLWYSLIIRVCPVSTFFFSVEKKEKEEECCYDSDE